MATKKFLPTAQTSQDVRCTFFRVNASVLDEAKKKITGEGLICLAIRKLDGNRYRVAASFKSPLDATDERRGIDIAIGRLRAPNRKPILSKKRKAKLAGRKPCNFVFSTKSRGSAELFREALSLMLNKKCLVRRRHENVSSQFVPDWLDQAFHTDGQTITSV